MVIGGLQKFSLIDYPGKVTAVVFTRGCNFRCPYCHNPELVIPARYAQAIPENGVLEFLETRKRKLDAVTITGGEPCIQPDLVDFVRKTKAMGFKVKLDTNGSRPEGIERIVGERLVDYVAMDIKAPLGKYQKVTGCPVESKGIVESVRIIMSSSIAYEFRTTVVPGLLTGEDLVGICDLIQGARLYALQRFIPSKIVDSSLMNVDGNIEGDIGRVKPQLEEMVQSVIVR